ncbi:hypothetical protein C2W62_36075 [Candidatus Entotheonella serta]|nr:hypothetical protein C2W62_36075 [Candidatus Entotheonella serta]
MICSGAPHPPRLNQPALIAWPLALGMMIVMGDMDETLCFKALPWNQESRGRTLGRVMNGGQKIACEHSARESAPKIEDVANNEQYHPMMHRRKLP